MLLKKSLIAIGLYSAVWALPLHAQDFSKFNFNIGGGITTPLNPTGEFAGINGNFNTGAGYNLNKHNSIFGEFMWNGLPPDRFALHPINALSGSTNLYSGTANYRYHMDSIGKSGFGVYAIAGGGWYYRHSSLKSYTVTPGTVCGPIYFWWGYACESGLVPTDNVLASKGSSAGGLNGGAGFTLRLSDTGWKFYMEARYHYAWSNRIPSVVVPVTFGLRFN